MFLSISPDVHPFITEYKDENNYKEAIGDELYRSQKFWLYEKMVVLDKSGKWIGYITDIYEPDRLNSLNVCSYDKSGHLGTIEGKLSQSDIEKYLDKEILIEFKDADKSEIKFTYQDNGNLDTITYYRSHGFMEHMAIKGIYICDEEGRMI